MRRCATNAPASSAPPAPAMASVRVEGLCDCPRVFPRRYHLVPCQTPYQRSLSPTPGCYSLSPCLTPQAIRDWRDHNSMNPREASCENCPPDSLKVGSYGSWTALGGERGTTRADSL